MKFNPDLIYVMLRVVCVVFLLPVGFFSGVVSRDGWLQGADDVWKAIFLSAGTMHDLLDVSSRIWFFGVIVLGGYRLWCYRHFCQKMRGNVPEEDETVRQSFAQVVRKMPCSCRRMKIVRNDELKIPIFVHLRYPQVVLPYGISYSEQQLNVIFAHECSHNSHNDLRAKFFCMCILLLHWFNPAAYLLLPLVDRWSEHMADVMAVKRMFDIHNTKPYFDCIIDLMPREACPDHNLFLFSALHTTKEELDRRIDFMKNYQNVKKVGKVATAAISAAFLCMVSVSSAFAGTTVTEGFRLADQFADLTQENENVSSGEKLVVAADGMVEHYVDVKDLDMRAITVYDNEDIGRYRTMSEIHTYDWKVNPHTRHVTSEFKVKAGGIISTSVGITPTTQTCMLGIMDDDGHARYVSGRGALGHDFSISTTNRYRVFVQNDSSITLRARGAYVYNDTTDF